MARSSSKTPVASDISDLRSGWILSLRGHNLSEKTIKSYVEALDLFREFLVADDVPTQINREHVEAFLSAQVRRWRPKTALIRYGNLRQCFNWCVDDGEISVTPMVSVKPPQVPEVPVPVVSDQDLKTLLGACTGASFEGRRDTALIRVLFDCGVLLGELTNLTPENMDLESGTVLVLGKSRRNAPYPSDRGRLGRLISTCVRGPATRMPSFRRYG